jgi:histidinol dehydrogenase
VLGDYCIGPNHTLPTAGTARYTGGLSVFTFVRIRTWLSVDAAQGAGAVADAVELAREEGLEGHARAAARRLAKNQ